MKKIAEFIGQFKEPLKVSALSLLALSVLIIAIKVLELKSDGSGCNHSWGMWQQSTNLTHFETGRPGQFRSCRSCGLTEWD